MKIGIDLDGVVIDSETTFRTYEEIFDIDILKGNNLINKKEPKPYENRINYIAETTKNGRKFTDQTGRSKGGRPSGRNRGNLFPTCGSSKP